MEGLVRASFAPTEARIAFTEDLFRKFNLAHAETALRDHPRADFQCECWQETCKERITLSVEDWALVRAQGNRFAVAPNHVAERFEAVLAIYPTFWLIEKFGEAGGIAEELARLERAASATVNRRDTSTHADVARRHNSRAGIRAIRRRAGLEE